MDLPSGHKIGQDCNDFTYSSHFQGSVSGVVIGVGNCAVPNRLNQTHLLKRIVRNKQLLNMHPFLPLSGPMGVCFKFDFISYHKKKRILIYSFTFLIK